MFYMYELAQYNLLSIVEQQSRPTFHSINHHKIAFNLAITMLWPNLSDGNRIMRHTLNF
jgi:hypothetical protein